MLMKLTFALGLALATTLTIAAQDWAKARLDQSPRPLEWVKVKSGERAGETPDASEPNKKARQEAWNRWKQLLKEQ